MHGYGEMYVPHVLPSTNTVLTYASFVCMKKENNVHFYFLVSGKEPLEGS